ncbi:DUF2059 domain-containing protein [Verrucomicrobia bacterium]|nr:DUF2059 domain-containing protein [Verrucomicrobiota bacterium]
MTKKIILSLLLLSIFSINANEKRNTAAVYELFTTMDMAKTYQQTIEKMLEMQVKQNPSIEPLKDTMLEFFDKYMGWKSMKEDMAKIYMNNFTDNELKQLIAFYKTPIGKKAAILVPTLASEGAAISQQRVQKNMPELQRMMQARMAESK